MESTSYITPERFNSLNTITMQIMLIRIPIGPLLIFDEGLNPRIGSALSASFSSISPNELIKKRKGPYFLCLGQNRFPNCGKDGIVPLR